MLVSVSALADAGDWNHGPLIGAARAGDGDRGFAELRVEWRLDYALTDWLSVRGAAGAGVGVSESGIPSIGKGFARGLNSGGLVLQYDVWSIVPELFIYGGVGWGSFHSGRAGALAALKWYPTASKSITLSGGWERDFGMDLNVGIVGLGVWF